MGQKDTNSPFNRVDTFLHNESVIYETIQLLQLMIQADTTNPPGNEIVLAKKLQDIIKNEKCSYLTAKIIESQPSRGNLIITVKGSEPKKNLTWGFHGHLDVVQAEGEWKYPPFSGKLVQLTHDKYIWGRGALDMKNQCTAYLMALLLLIREGWKPKGNIKIIFTADEESGGKWGAEFLTKKHYKDVEVDCLIDELGGEKLPTGPDFLIQRGEKGKAQMELTFTGTAGHGSMPSHFETYAIYKLVKVLNIIRKTKQPLNVTSQYKETIDALSIPRVFKFLLKQRVLIRPLFFLAGKLFKLNIGKFFLPLLSNTLTPTIIRAGEKVNVISPKANLSLDIRILPGETELSVLASLKKKFGESLFNEITFKPISIQESTISLIETEFYSKIESVMQELYKGANLVPVLGVGGTDSKFWRVKGIPCYGFSPFMLDKDLTYDTLMGLRHAEDERISVTNLMLATEFAYRLMKEL